MVITLLTNSFATSPRPTLVCNPMQCNVKTQLMVRASQAALTTVCHVHHHAVYENANGKYPMRSLAMGAKPRGCQVEVKIPIDPDRRPTLPPPKSTSIRSGDAGLGGHMRAFLAVRSTVVVQTTRTRLAQHPPPKSIGTNPPTCRPNPTTAVLHSRTCDWDRTCPNGVACTS